MASQSQESEEIITGINVTPLVDIILVVLVIFIVTASFVLRSSIQVNLPRAQTAEESNPGLLNLAVTSDGALYINGKPGSIDGIAAAVAEAKRLQPGRQASAFVSADVSARYGVFAAVVDRLRVEGVSDIVLDTRPPEVAAGQP